VWLGSRWLKVLDLRDDANQPMCDNASGISLVYNGKIYNYIELRSSLEQVGHRSARPQSRTIAARRNCAERSSSEGAEIPSPSNDDCSLSDCASTPILLAV